MNTKELYNTWKKDKSTIADLFLIPQNGNELVTKEISITKIAFKERKAIISIEMQNSSFIIVCKNIKDKKQYAEKVLTRNCILTISNFNQFLKLKVTAKENSHAQSEFTFISGEIADESKTHIVKI